MPNPSDEIKAKLDIVEVIREYLPLKAAGFNFRANCPFHREKSPSFMVSPEKQIWHCFGCFPKGSLIRIENGFMPIEKIKRNSLVISAKGRERRVIMTMKRDYQGEMFSLRTRKNNQIVNLTADHEVYAVKTANCKQTGRKTRLCQSRCRQRCPTRFYKEYKINKTAVKNLALNDYLIYPIVERVKEVKFLNLRPYLNRKKTSYGPIIRKLPKSLRVDDNLLKLLGYYIAEGSSHRAYVRFSLSSKEIDFAKEISRLIKKIFRLDSGFHLRRGDRSGLEITCCNSNLANIFENLCGQGAANKHIPFELDYLPSQKQKMILEAIFKGDGHTSRGGSKARAGERQIVTVSRLLAQQLKDILLRLSFQPGLTVTKAKIDKKGVKHKSSFIIRWREDLRGNYTDFLTQQNTKYWLLPIKEIRRKKFKGEVYNLTIDQDHSYIANHFAVGNCGKGGDVFSFVMEIESLTFVEVLRLLAKKAGVVLRSGADPALTSKRNVLLDIVELSAKFYHKVLLDSPVAAAAREYLKQRALTDETVRTWQIGYSPEAWETLINFLKSKNFSENEIFLAGMSVKKEKNPGFYDRFRGRIMFPISDLNGNTVGFTARVSPEKEATEKMGKYINSPATMIYEKSKILFGLDKAKMSIKREDAIILVEGQMDAITAEQNGFTNVIASSGTALTADQVNLIKRYSNNLLLSFDMDKAGDLASERGIAVAMQAEMNIKVIEIKEAKDPDECIKKNPDGWRQAVAAAKPVMQYYFDKTFAKLNKNDYEGQRQSLNILLPVIAKFGSKIEQDFWLKKLSQEVDTNENLLREEFNEIFQRVEQKQKSPASSDRGGSASPDKSAGQPRAELSAEKQSRGSRLSELLLALGLKYPVHLEYIINHIAPEHLVGASHKLFYKNLIIYYNKLIDFWTHEGGNFDLAINYQDLKDWFNNPEDLEQDNNDTTNNQAASHQCASSLDKLVLLADKDFYDYTAEKAKAEIMGWVAILKANYLSDRRRQTMKLIALAEKENLPPAEKAERLMALMQEFKALTEEINLLGIK